MNPPIDTLTLVETPEGIAIALQPAGFAVRTTAFMIDLAIRFGIIAASATALGAGGRFGTGLMFIVLFGINWLYSVIFELLPSAATPGKRIMGLEVLMADGLPITPAGCLIRNLLRAVDFLPLMYGFGILCILLRHDGRRLGDLAGGTLVVYKNVLRPGGSFSAAEPVPPTVPLTARQQAAITSFAWRVGRLTPERAEEIAALAAAALPEHGMAAAHSATAHGSAISLTERLVGIARWQHGQRRTVPVAAADDLVVRDGVLSA